MDNPWASSSQGKIVKLRRSRAHGSLTFSNVIRHPLLNCGNKVIYLSGTPFNFELDPAVSEVFDPAADLEFIGYLEGLIAKTDSLDATSKENLSIGDGGHGEKKGSGPLKLKPMVASMTRILFASRPDLSRLRSKWPSPSSHDQF
jgi:hypothetical protein